MEGECEETVMVIQTWNSADHDEEEDVDIDV